MPLPGSRTGEIQKQISIFVPLSDWKALRVEAARCGVPMTELCRRWMAADFQALRLGTEQRIDPPAAVAETISEARPQRPIIGTAAPHAATAHAKRRAQPTRPR